MKLKKKFGVLENVKGIYCRPALGSVGANRERVAKGDGTKALGRATCHKFLFPKGHTDRLPVATQYRCAQLDGNL